LYTDRSNRCYLDCGATMTEAEWLTCEEPELVLEFLAAEATERKLRLLVVACAQDYRVLTAAVDRLVATVEDHADGLATDEALHAARIAVVDSHWSGAHGTFAPQFLARPSALESAFHALLALKRHSKKNLCFLRDIIGNPFRPVAFEPAWRTDTARAIAAQMYESRDFGAMPILADALQDAGCDNDDVLNHCRDEKGVHVRGCWVVDLVLGKE
jgi:hypothetical protein